MRPAFLRALYAGALALVLALLGACASTPAVLPAATAAHALQMDVQPITMDGQQRLRVDLRFDGGAGGSTLLYLPDSWASESQMYKGVQALQAVTPGVTLADTDNPSIKQLSHAAAQPLHVRYELMQLFSGPVATPVKYKPILQPGYFNLIGHTAWVLPAWGKASDTGEADRFDVTLRWHELPAGWMLANSFGAGLAEQRFQAQREQLLAAIYVGGDFRLTRADVAGQPVYTAVRGSGWGFTDAEFNQTVARIIGLERSFWHSSEPYFLVTLIPLADQPGGYSVGGTGLTNSFATFVTPNVKPQQLERLITHEYFHNWNAHQMGRMPEPDEAGMYWMSEGFTDYYTHVLRLRGGLLTLPAFVDQLNDVLRQAYASPVWDADNARIIRDFWNNPAVKDLPYQRGMLLALRWNAQIQQASGGKQSFDDVMHGLLTAAKGPDGKPSALTQQHVNSVLQRFTGRDELPTMERHITQGQPLAPNPLWLGPHATLAWALAPRFDLGFDRERSFKDKIVSGVRPDSAAWKAGLRDGQQIQSASVYPSDLSRPAQIKVREADGGTRDINYLPHAANPPQVPQLRLPADLTPQQRDDTLRWLGAGAQAQ